MSANIPSTMPMSDLLKSTGYNCPTELQGKTFNEATSGSDTKISTDTAATVDVSTYTEPVEIEPAEGYDATKKVTLTLENIPTGADLEANHAATIDVSTYTEPVEITPAQGKDGMEKTTVTLSNIPSGSSLAPCAFSASDLAIYQSEIVCMGAVDFVSVTDSESHTYPITDIVLTYGNCLFSAGGYSIVKYLNSSLSAYTPVTPVGNENPQQEGWYEYIDDDYMQETSDSTVDASKTYYRMLQSITAVTFRNNEHNYTVATDDYSWTSGPLTPDA